MMQYKDDVNEYQIPTFMRFRHDEEDKEYTSHHKNKEKLQASSFGEYYTSIAYSYQHNEPDDFHFATSFIIANAQFYGVTLDESFVENETGKIFIDVVEAYLNELPDGKNISMSTAEISLKCISTFISLSKEFIDYFMQFDIIGILYRLIEGKLFLESSLIILIFLSKYDFDGLQLAEIIYNTFPLTIFAHIYISPYSLEIRTDSILLISEIINQLVLKKHIFPDYNMIVETFIAICTSSDIIEPSAILHSLRIFFDIKEYAIALFIPPIDEFLKNYIINYHEKYTSYALCIYSSILFYDIEIDLDMNLVKDIIDKRKVDDCAQAFNVVQNYMASEFSEERIDLLLGIGMLDSIIDKIEVGLAGMKRPAHIVLVNFIICGSDKQIYDNRDKNLVSMLMDGIELDYTDIELIDSSLNALAILLDFSDDCTRDMFRSEFLSIDGEQRLNELKCDENISDRIESFFAATLGAE